MTCHSHGYRCGVRFNFLVTVNNIEGHIRHIRVNIVEYQSGKTHIGRTLDSSAGRTVSSTAAVGHAAERIQSIVADHIKASNSVLCAVVGVSMVMTCHSHGHQSGVRSDGQSTFILGLCSYVHTRIIDSVVESVDS